MADIHILQAAKTGDNLQVVMHFPVADTSNDVSVSFRAALVNSGLGGITVLPDGDGTGGTISSAEKTQVQAGEIYEYTWSIARGKLISGGISLAAIQNTLRTFYAQQKADQTAQILVALKYFGAAIDEV